MEHFNSLLRRNAELEAATSNAVLVAERALRDRTAAVTIESDNPCFQTVHVHIYECV